VTDSYHQTCLSPDKKREVAWESLWRLYFSKLIKNGDCVLDLGCGYGNFINNVVARRRIAVDSWEGFPAHLDANIEHHVGSVTNLDFVDDGSVNFALASNIFEHLSFDEIRQVLDMLKKKLAPDGTLTILQPNYRYAYREYFDDYTHRTIFSHVSIVDFLEANGFETIELIPRFLPLTIRSRLLVRPWLIRLYLLSPFKWLGKQMLVRATPAKNLPSNAGVK
jgi:SAM-dependent methyltransferase